jgi:tetratricopeptide (TPR) repeat protein
MNEHKSKPDPGPEKIPIVTPEIEDGYNGVVKRLVCAGCQRVFYLTETAYQALHPTYCHTCSTKLVAEYEAKRQQELTEKEQKAKGEIFLALLADSMKEEIDRLIAREPTKSLYCEMKAGLLVKLGEDQQALLWYDKAMELDAPNASRYFSKGDVLARLDQAGDAMECYEKAISLQPEDIFGYTHKARLLEQLGREEEALALYNAFIAAHPSDLQDYVQKAMWFIKHDKYEEARLIHQEGRRASGKTD